MPEVKERIDPVRPEKEPTLIDVETRGEEKLPPEVETWVRKIEKARTTTITDDRTGSTLLTPATPASAKIVLPVTRQTFINGFKKAIHDAGLWFSTFILRFIKLKKGEVKFKDK